MAIKKINIQEMSKVDIGEMTELYNVIRRTCIAMSWGINNPTRFSDGVLGFKVQGLLHKGWVFLSVEYDDTFTITLGTSQKNFISEIKGVYLEDLIDRIDGVVERKSECTKEEYKENLSTAYINA